ncbi:gamma carbonic anhydrase family protein [candidate division LCP-89 bacterium B3_LCP]|uniref:Gamma carbonic anhydrase family protein n=1 Tax=candidate division LCP-89 bacterium B3_LCP TaxID=2012998 RepID=A0A532UZH6_UNCL8|nr:MAG: gamma carbonic anhydrase family protein [candidate division LCP-89 bacterium B3_LCP]
MLINYLDKTPILGKDVFIADNASIVGDVVIGDRSSVWFQAVLRGDLMPVRVGEDTNIQDGSILHVTHDQWPCIVGSRVTIGHGAIIHACTVEDECLIGMGAIILDDAVVETHSLVAAGSVVRPGFRVPSGQLVAGNPANIKRALSEREIQGIHFSVQEYLRLSKEFRNG